MEFRNVKVTDNLFGKLNYLKRTDNGKKFKKVKHDLVAIPYYAWTHRGKGKITAWMFRKIPALS